METLWTYDDLAEKLHVKKNTLMKWVSAGKLVKGVHYVKPGRTPLFIPSQIENSFLGLDKIKQMPVKAIKKVVSRPAKKSAPGVCRFNL